MENSVVNSSNSISIIAIVISFLLLIVLLFLNKEKLYFYFLVVFAFCLPFVLFIDFGEMSSLVIFFDLVTILVVLGGIYTYFFPPQVLIDIKDFFRNRKVVPLSYSSAKRKQKVLGDKLYCAKCSVVNKMNIEKEVYSNGMHMVYLKCSTCSSERKVRIDLV